MSFFFACPGCGKEIKAEEEWIGQAAECPFCLATVVVSKPATTAKKAEKKPIINFANATTKDIWKYAGKTFPQMCPKCHNVVSVEFLSQGMEVECPGCKHSFTAQRQSAAPGKIEYKTAVIEIDEPDKMAEQLNLYAKDGWLVVSQSTIFLSEGSIGLYGFGAGTRREGILYTFKREKKVG
jgi:DNA-directed RNA polymerase subunit RPC12/RpoP